MSHSHNLQICYFTRQMGMQVANGTKVANEVTLKGKRIIQPEEKPQYIVK